MSDVSPYFELAAVVVLQVVGEGCPHQVNVLQSLHLLLVSPHCQPAQSGVEGHPVTDTSSSSTSFGTLWAQKIHGT